MNEAGDKILTPHGAAITDLILATFRANGRLLRFGDVLGRDLRITSARWQVLGAIAGEPCTVSQIARYFELTRQGVLWVVNAMVKEGILVYSENPAHKRAKLVGLTPRGREIFVEMLRRQAAWANGLAEGLPIEQLRVGKAALESLSEAING